MSNLVCSPSARTFAFGHDWLARKKCLDQVNFLIISLFSLIPDQALIPAGNSHKTLFVMLEIIQVFVLNGPLLVLAIYRTCEIVVDRKENVPNSASYQSYQKLENSEFENETEDLPL